MRLTLASMAATQLLDALAHDLRHSASGAVALTGAGVSVASDVPSFRGDSGLWTRYDPAEYATLAAFRADPDRVWGFLRELDELLASVAPNAAHRALAALEDGGFLSHVVTQNVDELHQSAGSKQVVELHGSGRSLSCIDCSAPFPRDAVPERAVPRCAVCDGPVKPDVVLFGEQLPRRAFVRAQHAVERADLLLVVGTSAEVEPAAELPRLARRTGARIWEINPEPVLDADGTIAGNAEEILPAVAQRVLGRRWSRRRRRGRRP